ncbi:phage tail tube protein, partial [Staphylococcus aureus]
IRVAANTNVHKRFQVVVPGTAVKTYEGEFMIASFEEAGSYNGSVTYNLTLESAGVVTIT